MATSPPVELKQVTVNVTEFVRTRDALVSAYTKLSSSIDKAVKAYIEHTDAVIAGDTPLDVSYLTQPFHELSSAAQRLLIDGAKDAAAASPEVESGGGAKKTKRVRAPREPGAPKRPQTAYFLFMRDQRPLLQKELADKSGGQQAGDIAKLGTERWNSLGDKKKQKYKDEYSKLRSTFVQELKNFKAGGGKLTAGEEKLVRAPAGELDAHDETHPLPALGAEEGGDDDDDESDDSDDDSSNSSASDDDDEEASKTAPVTARTSTSPDVTKKTPKSALKKTTKRDPAATAVPPAPKFSAVNEPAKKFSSLDPPATATSSSPERKRKAEAEADEPAKKRRGRKPAAETAAPASEKKKKEKEKKKAKE